MTAGIDRKTYTSTRIEGIRWAREPDISTLRHFLRLCDEVGLPDNTSVRICDNQFLIIMSEQWTPVEEGKYIKKEQDNG